MGRKGLKRSTANHFLARGSVDGWFVCVCGCGYVMICRHCVPSAPRGIDETLCDAEEQRLQVGQYAPKEDGRVV